MIRAIYDSPDWKHRTGGCVYSYADSVLISVDEIGGKYRGQSSMLESVMLIRLLWTLPRQRNKKITLQALKSLVDLSDLTGCGIAALISPFKMYRKNIYDIGHASRLLRQDQFEVLPDHKADFEIEGMKRLLTSAGFESGFPLQTVTAVLNENFKRDRQFVYIPSTLNAVDRDLLLALKNMP
ncbi:MAG: hypothetical protein NTW52_18610 [Planctomycetota bacterium]|nr:hypothetical protein [Planctomycetota bacterium]